MGEVGKLLMSRDKAIDIILKKGLKNFIFLV